MSRVREVCPYVHWDDDSDDDTAIYKDNNGDESDNDYEGSDNDDDDTFIYHFLFTFSFFLGRTQETKFFKMIYPPTLPVSLPHARPKKKKSSSDLYVAEADTVICSLFCPVF